jgi:DNA-binding CsgD family transcriptional regulator
MPDKTHEFTDLEFEVIFGVCRRATNSAIAAELRIAEDTTKGTMISIYDKARVTTRLELVSWVRTTLNNELRRRSEELP